MIEAVQAEPVAVPDLVVAASDLVVLTAPPRPLFLAAAVAPLRNFWQPETEQGIAGAPQHGTNSELLRHKVAYEISAQLASLRRAAYVGDSVRVWTGTRNQWKEGQYKRIPRCKRCCRRCFCCCCFRTSHLFNVYLFLVTALTLVLGLVPRTASIIAVWALWVVPGIWTPVALVKACTGCNGMATLEWRVQAVFWFGLWLIPMALLYFPVTSFVHGEFLSSPNQLFRQLGILVFLSTLWMLGWGLAWVHAAARRVQRAPRVGVDRYAPHPDNAAAGGAAESAVLTDIWRARPWPRRLPRGKGKMRQAAIVLEGFFWCSVAFHPSLSWASLPAPLTQLNLDMPPAVTTRARPELLFLGFGLADAGALGMLGGLSSSNVDDPSAAAAAASRAEDGDTGGHGFNASGNEEVSSNIGSGSDSSGLAFLGLHGLAMLVAGLLAGRPSA